MRDIHRYLVKANRISAWLLVALFIIYGITGYGWTRGIIDRQFSVYWHTVLTLPLIVLLSFHSLYGLRIVLCSWGVRPKRLMDYALIGVGAFFMIGTVYIMYIR
jgi:succinate dehydrogenase/fumarate reductase cytochrome b subunit